MKPEEKLIIALDFDNFESAGELVEKLEAACFFKVGLQAYLQFGDRLIQFLQERNKQLFLDLKFKDIPNTVHGAVSSALKYEPDFLTIHLTGGGEMIRKAVEAAASRPTLAVLGVTILTSLSDQDLEDTGMALSTRDAVLKLVGLGLDNSLTSFVCSPLEIAPIREKYGDKPVLVTPGIRPDWSVKGDQKRVFTPRMAVDAGSDYLVIGRPVTKADNPAEAFNRILEEIS